MPIADEHVALLASLLKERVGFEVRPEGYNLLRSALADRLRDQPEPDLGRYLRTLQEEEEELERLLPLVTIGKTSFFRDPGQFRALASLLPGLLAEAREEKRRLAIWSAGCASGEEVYSIAITLLEAGAAPGDVELLATDINPEAIAAAARGRYREDRMAPVSAERMSRFFLEDGEDHWVASPELRAMVSGFRTHNLNAKEFPLPASGAWDVIFCRNVLIYFDRKGIRTVAQKLHASLRPGGWLLLGYSESLFKLFDGFELVELQGSFLYRRPPERPQAPAPPPVEEVVFPAELVQRAIAPPARHPLRVPEPEPAPRRRRAPEPDPLDRAIGLVERGEFLEAAGVLERALAAQPKRLELRVTLGNVYALLKRYDEAEACFEQALAEDPLAVEALLYQGLFFLERSRYTEAERALSRVLYLEPDFALAHYLLGRCQERQRRFDGARRSYRNALRALGTAQRPLRAFYPDLPRDPDTLDAAARLALAAL